MENTMIEIQKTGLFIDRNDPDVAKAFDKYGATHKITPRIGTEVDLRRLKPNESVVYGDGRTYYFLLTPLLSNP